MNILVLGIGQSLRGDDAAGLEAVRLWQKQYPQCTGSVHVALSELPGLGLLDLLEGMDAAILVDAVQGSDAAGTLYRIGLDDLDSFAPGSGSAHGWGIAETLQLGRTLYPSLAGCRITLIGIAARSLDMGAGLSPEVEKALAGAAQRIEEELQGHLVL